MEVVIEDMPFPHFDNPQATGALIFLSVCSARKLMNRIHSAVYSTGDRGTINENEQAQMDKNVSLASTAFTIESMGRVCEELSHQLHTWFDSLPDAIKPDLSLEAPRVSPEGLLCLRYWSSKHIIYRPCMLYVASLPNDHRVPPEILANCQICIDGCRGFVTVASRLLLEYGRHIWTTLQS